MEPIEDGRPKAQSDQADRRQQEWDALCAIQRSANDREPLRDGQSLLQVAGFGNALGVLRLKLAFPQEVFALAARPLVLGYAEFVQMLPVVGSRRFGERGGQLQRGLTRALQVLDRRRALVLPPGGAPEEIGAQAHRWTYATLVAALLQDVGRVTDGLSVYLEHRDGTLHDWNPATGSMAQCGAMAYRVDRGAGRDGSKAEGGSEPGDLARSLFERSVPSSIQEWLQEDPRVWTELLECLRESVGTPGPIAALLAGGREARAPITRDVRRAAEEATSNSMALSSDTGQAESVAAESDPPSVASEATAFLEGVVPDRSARAQQFLAWLESGLASGILASNRADAMVFRAPEGLLLVSPKVFRVCAQVPPKADEPVAEAVRRLQRDVLRAGWHRCTPAGTNFHAFAFAPASGPVRQVQGILIPDPQRLLRALPPVDDRVRIMADSVGAT